MVFKSARLQGSSFYFLELQMWGAVDDGKTGGENVYFFWGGIYWQVSLLTLFYLRQAVFWSVTLLERDEQSHKIAGIQ